MFTTPQRFKASPQRYPQTPQNFSPPQTSVFYTVEQKVQVMLMAMEIERLHKCLLDNQDRYNEKTAQFRLQESKWRDRVDELSNEVTDLQHKLHDANMQLTEVGTNGPSSVSRALSQQIQQLLEQNRVQEIKAKQLETENELLKRNEDSADLRQKMYNLEQSYGKLLQEKNDQIRQLNKKVPQQSQIIRQQLDTLNQLLDQKEKELFNWQHSNPHLDLLHENHQQSNEIKLLNEKIDLLIFQNNKLKGQPFGGVSQQQQSILISNENILEDYQLVDTQKHEGSIRSAGSIRTLPHNEPFRTPHQNESEFNQIMIKLKRLEDKVVRSPQQLLIEQQIKLIGTLLHIKRLELPFAIYSPRTTHRFTATPRQQNNNFLFPRSASPSRANNTIHSKPIVDPSMILRTESIGSQHSVKSHKLQDVNRASSKYEESNLKNESYAQQIQALQEENQRLKNQLQRTDQQLSEQLQQKYTRAFEELERLETQIKNQQIQHSKEKSDLEQQVKALQQQLETLYAELGNLKKQLNQKDNLLQAEHQKQIGLLKEQIRSLQKQLQDKNQKPAVIEESAQAGGQKQQLERLESGIDGEDEEQQNQRDREAQNQLEQENGMLAQQNQELQSQNQQLMTQMKQNEAKAQQQQVFYLIEICELEAQISTQQQQIEELKQKLTKQGQENQNLQQQLQAKSGSGDAELRKLQEQSKNQLQQIQQLQQQIAKLEDQKQNLQSQLSAKSGTAEAELRKLQEQNNNQQQQIQQLQQQINNLEKSKQSLQEQLLAASGQGDAQQKLKNLLQLKDQEIRDLQSSLNQLSKDKQQYEELLTKTQQQSQTLMSQYESQIQALNEQLQQTQQSQQWQVKYSTLVTTTTTEIQTLTQELEEAQSQIIANQQWQQKYETLLKQTQSQKAGQNQQASNQENLFNNQIATLTREIESYKQKTKEQEQKYAQLQQSTQTEINSLTRQLQAQNKDQQLGEWITKYQLLESSTRTQIQTLTRDLESQKTLNKDQQNKYAQQAITTQSQIDSLMNQLESSKQQNQLELTQTIKKWENKYTQLETTNQLQIQNLNEQLTKYKNQKSQVQNPPSQKSAESQQLTLIHQQEIDNLRSANETALQEASSKYSQLESSTKSQISALNRQLESLRVQQKQQPPPINNDGEIQLKDREIAKLKSIIDQQDQELKIYQSGSNRQPQVDNSSQIIYLQQQLSVYQQEITNLKSQCKQHEEQQLKSHLLIEDYHQQIETLTLQVQNRPAQSPVTSHRSNELSASNDFSKGNADRMKMKQLQDKIDILSKENLRLQQEQLTLRSDKELIQIELQSIQKQLSHHQNLKVSSITESAGALQEQINELNIELQRTHDKLQASEKNESKLKDQVQSTKTEWQMNATQLNRTITGLQDQLKFLQGQLDKESKELSDALILINQLQNKNNQTNNQFKQESFKQETTITNVTVPDLSNQLRDKDNQIYLLQKDKERLQSDYQLLEVQTESLRKQLFLLQNQPDQASREIERLKSSLQLRDDEIRLLEQRYQQLQSSQNQESQKLKESSFQSTVIQKSSHTIQDNPAHIQEITRLQNELDSLRRDSKTLMRRSQYDSNISQLQQENLRIQAELQQMKQSKQVPSPTSERLRSSSQVVYVQDQKLLQELQSLKYEVNDLERLNETLRSNNQQLNIQIEQLMRDNQKLNNIIQTPQSQSQTQQIELLKKQNKEQDEVMTSMRQQYEKSIQNLRQQIQELQDDNLNFKRSTQNNTEIITEKSSTSQVVYVQDQQLIQELQTLKYQNNDYQKLNETLNSNNQQLKIQIEQLLKNNLNKTDRDQQLQTLIQQQIQSQQQIDLLKKQNREQNEIISDMQQQYEKTIQNLNSQAPQPQFQTQQIELLKKQNKEQDEAMSSMRQQYEKSIQNLRQQIQELQDDNLNFKRQTQNNTEIITEKRSSSQVVYVQDQKQLQELQMLKYQMEDYKKLNETLKTNNQQLNIQIEQLLKTNLNDTDRGQQQNKYQQQIDVLKKQNREQNEVIISMQQQYEKATQNLNSQAPQSQFQTQQIELLKKQNKEQDEAMTAMRQQYEKTIQNLRTQNQEMFQENINFKKQTQTHTEITTEKVVQYDNPLLISEVNRLKQQILDLQQQLSSLQYRESEFNNQILILKQQNTSQQQIINRLQNQPYDNPNRQQIIEQQNEIHLLHDQLSDLDFKYNQLLNKQRDQVRYTYTEVTQTTPRETEDPQMLQKIIEIAQLNRQLLEEKELNQQLLRQAALRASPRQSQTTNYQNQLQYSKSAERTDITHITQTSPIYIDDNAIQVKNQEINQLRQQLLDEQFKNQQLNQQYRGVQTNSGVQTTPRQSVTIQRTNAGTQIYTEITSTAVRQSQDPYILQKNHEIVRLQRQVLDEQEKNQQLLLQLSRPTNQINTQTTPRSSTFIDQQQSRSVDRVRQAQLTQTSPRQSMDPQIIQKNSEIIQLKRLLLDEQLKTQELLQNINTQAQPQNIYPIRQFGLVNSPVRDNYYTQMTQTSARQSQDPTTLARNSSQSNTPRRTTEQFAQSQSPLTQQQLSSGAPTNQFIFDIQNLQTQLQQEQSKNRQLSFDLQQQTRAVSSRDSENQYLKVKIESLSQQLQDKQQQIQVPQSQIEQKNNEIASLRSQLLESMDKYDQLSKQIIAPARQSQDPQYFQLIQKNNNEVSQLKSTIQQQEDQIAQLKYELSLPSRRAPSITIQDTSLTNQLQAQKKQIEDLQKKQANSVPMDLLDLKNNEIAKLTQQIHELKEQNQQLLSQVPTSVRQSQKQVTLRQSQDPTYIQLSQKNIEITNLKQKLLDTQDQAQQQQQQLLRTQSDLLDAQNRISSLNSELNNNKNNLEVNNQLNQELFLLRQELTLEQNKNKRLQQQLLDQQKELIDANVYVEQSRKYEQEIINLKIQLSQRYTQETVESKSQSLTNSIEAQIRRLQDENALIYNEMKSKEIKYKQDIEKQQSQFEFTILQYQQKIKELESSFESKGQSSERGSLYQENQFLAQQVSYLQEELDITREKLKNTQRKSNPSTPKPTTQQDIQKEKYQYQQKDVEDLIEKFEDERRQNTKLKTQLEQQYHQYESIVLELQTQLMHKDSPKRDSPNRGSPEKDSLLLDQLRRSREELPNQEPLERSRAQSQQPYQNQMQFEYTFKPNHARGSSFGIQHIHVHHENASQKWKEPIFKEIGYWKKKYEEQLAQNYRGNSDLVISLRDEIKYLKQELQQQPQNQAIYQVERLLQQKINEIAQLEEVHRQDRLRWQKPQSVVVDQSRVFELESINQDLQKRVRQLEYELGDQTKLNSSRNSVDANSDQLQRDLNRYRQQSALFEDQISKLRNQVQTSEEQRSAEYTQYQLVEADLKRMIEAYKQLERDNIAQKQSLKQLQDENTKLRNDLQSRQYIEQTQSQQPQVQEQLQSLYEQVNQLKADNNLLQSENAKQAYSSNNSMKEQLTHLQAEIHDLEQQLEQALQANKLMNSDFKQEQKYNDQLQIQNQQLQDQNQKLKNDNQTLMNQNNQLTKQLEEKQSTILNTQQVQGQIKELSNQIQQLIEQIQKLKDLNNDLQIQVSNQKNVNEQLKSQLTGQTEELKNLKSDNSNYLNELNDLDKDIQTLIAENQKLQQSNKDLANNLRDNAIERDQLIQHFEQKIDQLQKEIPPKKDLELLDKLLGEKELRQRQLAEMRKELEILKRQNLRSSGLEMGAQRLSYEAEIVTLQKQLEFAKQQLEEITNEYNLESSRLKDQIRQLIDSNQKLQKQLSQRSPAPDMRDVDQLNAELREKIQELHQVKQQYKSSLITIQNLEQELITKLQRNEQY